MEHSEPYAASVKPYYRPRKQEVRKKWTTYQSIFGTFVKEDQQNLPIYGITQNIRSSNPAVIATHEYVSLWKDVKRAKKYSDKLKYLMYPPGWSHDGEDRTSNTLRKQL